MAQEYRILSLSYARAAMNATFQELTRGLYYKKAILVQQHMVNLKARSLYHIVKL